MVESKCQFIMLVKYSIDQKDDTLLLRKWPSHWLSLPGGCPYFLSHSIGVKTNMPLKQTLGKPDTFGSLVKWVVELSEYDISYLPRTTVKAQALADFVSEMVGAPMEDTSRVEN
ncbi:hypothetical protein Sango_1741900 [Sesamum angolense]|uniref:Uncharacterized protein n=1 Tax=Sesamum angolense TaxID=2727404 RepID=A0AAE1WM53_9LAMI|nr:hypothetical protein Sango_1741900 [Sesamum angolense]